MFPRLLVVFTLGMIAFSGWALWLQIRIEFLIHRLDDRDFPGRWRVAQDLGELGPQAATAIPALREAMSESDPLLRTAAAGALCNIGTDNEEPATILADAVQWSRPIYYPHCGGRGRDLDADYLATSSLMRLGPTRIPQLLIVLCADRANARAWAAEFLGRMGPEAKAAELALADALADRDPLVRAVAAYSLWRITREARILESAMCDALGVQDDNIQAVVSTMIEEMSGVAIPGLQKAIKTEDAPIRKRAAMQLSRFGSTAPMWRMPASPAVLEEIVFPALVAATADEDSEVRVSAAVGLSGIPGGMPLAIPVLVTAVQDGTCELRWWAARRLGEIGVTAEGAVPSLISALEDHDEGVRGNVEGALMTLAALDDSVVAELTQLADDDWKSPDMRDAASRVLTKLSHVSDLARPKYERSEW